MNNYRYHSTTIILEFYNDNAVKIIYWPLYSSDFNPIESI